MCPIPQRVCAGPRLAQLDREGAATIWALFNPELYRLAHHCDRCQWPFADILGALYPLEDLLAALTMVERGQFQATRKVPHAKA